MSEHSLRDTFWNLPLEQLTRHEWEALCDGCARCCLKKLQDEVEAATPVSYTRVVCRYLDQQQCQCQAYDTRQVLVPDCLVLDMDVLRESVDWIPDTCAYKLRFLDKPLPEWHPLLTGSQTAMEQADICVTDKVISEDYVHPDGLEEHIIRWVQA